MPRKLVVLTALAGILAAAPMGAYAKDTKKESESFFDISDEVEEAGSVVKTGANKTVGFFEGLFDDDEQDGKKKKK